MIDRAAVRISRDGSGRALRRDSRVVFGKFDPVTLRLLRQHR